MTAPASLLLCRRPPLDCPFRIRELDLAFPLAEDTVPAEAQGAEGDVGLRRNFLAESGYGYHAGIRLALEEPPALPLPRGYGARVLCILGNPQEAGVKGARR